ncbi:MAG: hypothetical protein DRJ15_04085 [Bacteroidetes bacterium]|nr:MAG: hypothetical protein DRJ15_04085 [Bacteroidota bacterium]
MTITRLIYKLFLPFIMLLLISCEGSTERVWSVKNSTSDLVKVRAELRINSDTVWENIEAGDSRIITITTEDWGNSDPQFVYDVFSGFLVTKIGDTIHKNWADDDNWEIYFEQTKHKPDHYQQTYDFVVTDVDFE